MLVHAVHRTVTSWQPVNITISRLGQGRFAGSLTLELQVARTVTQAERLLGICRVGRSDYRMRKRNLNLCV